MKSRFCILLGLFIILSSTNMTVGNPGGNDDGNRDFTCGGSCHGDPSLSKISEGEILIDSKKTVFAGTAVSVNVNITLDSLSNTNLLGVFLLSSLNGNGDQPHDHGWKIIQDPNGGTNNYVEVIMPDNGNIIVSWILIAPEQPSELNLYAQINHGKSSNQGNYAYTGVSDAHSIEIISAPENLPSFAESWVAPKYRLSGDNSPLVILTKNTDKITVEWRFDEETYSHDAQVELIEENMWQVYLPFTTGDLEIKYMVTTYNGEFPVNQPWLTIGTLPPTFEGTLLGARLQAFAFTAIIIGFLTTLQSNIVSKQNQPKVINLRPDNPENNISKSNLIPSSEYPGWLWDTTSEQWVADSGNYSAVEARK